MSAMSDEELAVDKFDDAVAVAFSFKIHLPIWLLDILALLYFCIILKRPNEILQIPYIGNGVELCPCQVQIESILEMQPGEETSVHVS